MNKVWKIQPKKSDDLTTQLLINRGLTKKEEIEKFFNPKLSDFEKDLEITGISKAIKRIKQAIEAGEGIVVYGDYDVDGICASAIVYKSLSTLRAKILPYIPHREKEGYGLSEVGLNFVKESGAKLVITVDHGIGAVKMAAYAKKLGLDLVITDHHTKGPQLPEAVAIVHSIKMCGTAVAWSVMRKMIPENLSKEMLEFVALATVCDLLPLQGVNRSLVKEGLEVMNRTKCLGLKALVKEAGVEGKIDAYVLGHYLGPRLNAIGRIDHAMDALRLLCTKEPLKAARLARVLTQANIKRQELTQLAVEQARLLAKEESGIHVLASKDWIPGIIGLIAGRMAEETGRPSIAISMGEVVSKGSARSGNGINIVETIRRVQHLLVDVGGHKGAAGFTIETTKIEEFKIQLTKLLKQPKMEEQVLEIEALIPSKKITKSLVHDLQKFEPFGFGNPNPIFATEKMVISDVRTVGAGKHLKFRADGIEAIGFGMGGLENNLKNGQPVDLAYFLEINRFNGIETLQLKVRDIRV